MRRKMICILLVICITQISTSVNATTDTNWRGNSFYKTDEDRHSMQSNSPLKEKVEVKRTLSDIFKGLELALKTSSTIEGIDIPKDNTFGDIDTEPSSLPNKNADIVEIARKYIGVPYVFGGKTPSGFDCSGYVSYVYKEYGIDIPSYTVTLMSVGDEVPISRLKNGIFSDLIPGDLMLSLGHVTLYVGNGKMIHAPYEGQTVKEVDVGSWWIAEVSCVRRLIN